MKIDKDQVKIFKIRNRQGYAAIYADCLTEGQTAEEAFERLTKAINRISKSK